jgi:hypothetical protein
MSELKNQIKYFIEQNDIKSLENLLKNESNLLDIKQHKYFDPIVVAIKQNHVHLIDYFHSKGFQINANIKSHAKLVIPKSHKKRKLDSEENAAHKLASKSEISFSYSSCLIEAIRCLNVAAIKNLIELNVNLNSSDYKHIPLQIAYNIYRSAKKDSKIVEVSIWQSLYQFLFMNSFIYQINSGLF